MAKAESMRMAKSRFLIANRPRFRRSEIDHTQELAAASSSPEQSAERERERGTRSLAWTVSLSQSKNGMSQRFCSGEINGLGLGPVLGLGPRVFVVPSVFRRENCVRGDLLKLLMKIICLKIYRLLRIFIIF